MYHTDFNYHLIKYGKLRIYKANIKQAADMGHNTRQLAFASISSNVYTCDEMYFLYKENQYSNTCSNQIM